MNVVALVRAMRPKQWIKNVFVLAALVFAAKFGDPQALLKTALAFVAFCFLSSSVYLLNDVLDIEADRLHPHKANRPIASGAVSAGVALLVALALAITGLGVSVVVSRALVGISAAFLALNLAYCFAVKHWVIADALAIAVGFVLRALAGAVAISVPVSPWLVVTTFFLALFLAFNKRRAELEALGSSAGEHRRNLLAYTPELLDQLVQIVTACVLMSYALYTFGSAQSQGLMWSLPLVVYGVFRYLFLAHTDGLGGQVEEVVLGDRPLLVCVLLWAAAVVTTVAWSGGPSL